MAYREKEITKVYYTSTDLRKRFGITWSKLNYYMKYFNIPVVRQGEGSMPKVLFKPKQVSVLDRIMEMVNDGYKLSAIKRKLEQS